MFSAKHFLYFTLICLLIVPQLFAIQKFIEFPIKIALKLTTFKIGNIIDSSIGGTACAQDLKALIEDALALKPWALRMIDANPKIQPGLLSGNIFPWGDYDQCLAIRHKRKEANLIKGQYCYGLVVDWNYTAFKKDYSEIHTILEATEEIKFPNASSIGDLVNNFMVPISCCVPSSCSAENLRNLTGDVAKYLDLPIKAIFLDSLCQYKEKPQYVHYAMDKYVFILLAAIIVTPFISTISENTFKLHHEYLSMFSISRNLRGLFHLDSSRLSTLSCLHGIRSLSSIWVVLGHSILLSCVKPNINFFYILFEYIRDFRHFFFMGALLSVDTFFTIGGLLVSYTTLTKQIHMSAWQFYMWRLARYVPGLAVMVLFYISIVKYLGDGPLWFGVTLRTAEVCTKGWFYTLLQLSNANEYMCVEQSWYTSIDFQLCLVAPFLIGQIRKSPKRGLIMIAVGFCASMTYTALVLLLLDLSSLESIKWYLLTVYVSPLSRITSWLIGFTAGYFIHKFKKQQLQIPPGLNIFLTSASIIAMLIAVFANVCFFRNLTKRKALILHSVFDRIIWCLGLTWIIFSCIFTPKSVINRVLSNGVFVILDRLGFGIFLTHLLVIILGHADTRSASSFTNLTIFHRFAGDLFLSLLASVLFYLTVEAPVVRLFDHINKKAKKGDKKKELHID